MLAFRDAVYPGQYLFEYYCRAVCAGRFIVPARVAAVYTSEVKGYSPRGQLVIKER